MRGTSFGPVLPMVCCTQVPRPTNKTSMPATRDVLPVTNRTRSRESDFQLPGFSSTAVPLSLLLFPEKQPYSSSRAGAASHQSWPGHADLTAMPRVAWGFRSGGRRARRTAWRQSPPKGLSSSQWWSRNVQGAEHI